MFRLLALLLWLPFAALAQTYPDPLSDTVSDYAGLLSPQTEARISASLQAAREETGIHIVLATIGSQRDYGYSGRFADFATGWFNSWGIGDKERNDGILILVGREDREMRIALGRSYDVIWDGRAQRVIDTAMLPAFRDDNYAKGLEDGAAAAIDLLARPFANNEPVTETSGFPAKPWLASLLMSLVPVGIGLLFLMLVFKRRLGDFVARWRTCPNCGARRITVSREVVLEPGEESEGQSVRHERCGSCGNDRVEYFTLPSFATQRAEQSSSSSSSGFGGGSSGGGGASGKW